MPQSSKLVKAEMAERTSTVRLTLTGGTTVCAATTQYRIVIAAGYPIYRAGLRSTLELDPELAVIGEAADGREALRLVRDRVPDLLLLDLSLREHSRFDVLAEIRHAHVDVKTILLAEQIGRAEQMESLRLGVRGIVLKGTPVELFRKSIRTVATGGYWLDRDMVRDLVDAIAQPTAIDRDLASPKWDLTPREREVVALLVKGYTNRDIAHHCSIAEDTVKRHVTNVFDKTGRSSRLELTLLALDKSLVAPEDATTGGTRLKA